MVVLVAHVDKAEAERDAAADWLRGLHHATGAARRAEAAAFAGERHQMFMATAIALHADEAMLEKSAAQIVFELRNHQPRQLRVAGP